MHFKQFETQRFDLGEDTEKSRLVRQLPGQHGVTTAPPGPQAGECGEHAPAQVTPYVDLIRWLLSVARAAHAASLQGVGRTANTRFG
jgi:hypothetical protein